MYGGVPWEASALRVIDWPLSSLGAEGESVTERAGFIANSAAEEVTTAVDDTLSVNDAQ